VALDASGEDAWIEATLTGGSQKSQNLIGRGTPVPTILVYSAGYFVEVGQGHSDDLG
jgi:hypothetical protein